MRTRRAMGGSILRILCTIALLLLGLGHQPPVAVATGDIAIAGYTLPDGSVPTLCIAAGHSNGKIVAKPGCDVCRLAGSIILPEPDSCGSPIVLEASLSNPLRGEVTLFGAKAHGRANSRAPPLRA